MKKSNWEIVISVEANDPMDDVTDFDQTADVIQEIYDSTGFIPSIGDSICNEDHERLVKEDKNNYAEYGFEYLRINDRFHIYDQKAKIMVLVIRVEYDYPDLVEGEMNLLDYIIIFVIFTILFVPPWPPEV